MTDLFAQEPKRTLGPEMQAEGWIVIGGDWLVWMHPPSRRAVTIEGPLPRRSAQYDCMAVPALPSEPADPLDEGFIVACGAFNDDGNPERGESFWTPSYLVALRVGRRIRIEILAGGEPKMPKADQLSIEFRA